MRDAIDAIDAMGLRSWTAGRLGKDRWKRWVVGRGLMDNE